MYRERFSEIFIIPRLESLTITSTHYRRKSTHLVWNYYFTKSKITIVYKSYTNVFVALEKGTLSIFVGKIFIQNKTFEPLFHKKESCSFPLSLSHPNLIFWVWPFQMKTSIVRQRFPQPTFYNGSQSLAKSLLNKHKAYKHWESSGFFSFNGASNFIALIISRVRNIFQVDSMHWTYIRSLVFSYYAVTAKMVNKTKRKSP